MKSNSKIFCLACRARRSMKLRQRGVWTCNMCGSIHYVSEGGIKIAQLSKGKA